MKLVTDISYASMVLVNERHLANDLVERFLAAGKLTASIL